MSCRKPGNGFDERKYSTVLPKVKREIPCFPRLVFDLGFGTDCLPAVCRDAVCLCFFARTRLCFCDSEFNSKIGREDLIPYRRMKRSQQKNMQHVFCQGHQGNFRLIYSSFFPCNPGSRRLYYSTTVRLKYRSIICKKIELFRSIPVGRFLQGIPVQIEDFDQGEV